MARLQVSPPACAREEVVEREAYFELGLAKEQVAVGEAPTFSLQMVVAELA